MEKMRIELAAAGHEVHFVAVNAISAVETQQKLVDRCAFPIFQDTEAIGAWDLHNGRKDDFYVYDRQGVLTDYFSISGERSVYLNTSEGYANLKNAILAALGAP